MNENHEGITAIEPYHPNYFERIAVLPDRFADWEHSVQQRLDQNPEFTGFNRQIVECKLHYMQLATLSDFNTKMTIRYFSAVGRSKLFGHEGSGAFANIDREAALLPEASAKRQLAELSSQRGEAFGDEFDELVVTYLDQVSQRLGGGVNLAEKMVQIALTNLDSQARDGERVNLFNTLNFLEHGKPGEEDKYYLSPASRQLADLLKPLCHPAVSHGGWAETSFPYSISESLRYVEERARFSFLNWSHAGSIDLDEVFAENFMNGRDIVDDFRQSSTTSPHFKHPNVLEQSIQNMYQNQGYADEEKKLVQLDKNTFSREIFSAYQGIGTGPLGVLDWLFWERFDGGTALSGVFDYPGIEKLV